jgi:hypothetical protein
VPRHPPYALLRLISPSPGSLRVAIRAPGNHYPETNLHFSDTYSVSRNWPDLTLIRSPSGPPPPCGLKVPSGSLSPPVASFLAKVRSLQARFFLVLPVCGCQGARRAQPGRLPVSQRDTESDTVTRSVWRQCSLSAPCCCPCFPGPPARPRPTSVSPGHPCPGLLPRKEVIQPHLPIRLPCYDFTPVIGLTFVRWLLAVTPLPSGAPNSHGVTGGVYKARERIHRDMLIRDY